MTVPDRGLRVLTWNVRNLLGDPLAVRRVVRAVAPDVLCLQEGPRLPGSRNRLAGLARDWGLFFVAGGRASGGTALLASTRTQVTDAAAFRLPGRRRDYPRGAVTASVSLPETAPVRVACVHLPLDAGARPEHLRLVRAELERPGLGAVVGGDLNERPGGPAWTALAGFLVDPEPLAAATFPARSPRVRIDAVLLSPQLPTAGYDLWRGQEDDIRRASDHRPVLATVLLPARHP